MSFCKVYRLFGMAGLLLGAVLFFYGCKSKQKAIDLSKQNTELSVSSTNETSSFGVSLGIEESTVLTQLDESSDEVIEITGPAVIHPDGTIETTSDQSKVKKLAKNDKSKTTKTNTVQTDSVYTSTTDQSEVDSTRTESRKDKAVTVEKEPEIFAMIGLFGVLLIVVWLAWRYLIKPRIM